MQFCKGNKTACPVNSCEKVADEKPILSGGEHPATRKIIIRSALPLGYGRTGPIKLKFGKIRSKETPDAGEGASDKHRIVSNQQGIDFSVRVGAPIEIG